MSKIIRGAAIALAVLTLAGCGDPTNASRDALSHPVAPSGPPNLVWIIAEADTVALETLAAEGARFTQAFAVTPNRGAGRSAILTGMPPAAFGAHGPGGKTAPPPTVRSVAERLRATGYFTTFASHDPETAALGDAFRPPPRDGAPPGADRVPLGSWDQVGAEAHWRHRDRRQPFFAVLDLTGTGMRTSDSDQRIAQILAELDADEAAGNTAVFAFTEPRPPARTVDRTLTAADLQITLAVRWPGHIPPGIVRDDPVTTVDFAPTLLSLGGAPIPDHLPGRVLLGDSEMDVAHPSSALADVRRTIRDWMVSADRAPSDETAAGQRPTTARPESYPRGGIFHVAPRVSITCPTEGAVIEYTTDSFEPFRWRLYTGPFRFVDWHLRFRCGRLGYHDSEVVKYDFDVEYNWWDY
ncbi:MAG: sulfatase-like hydrolase/transferase [Acidobacteria bacterium]|nr:sulfatase-like hydrolase/transferase [Acidobacteriota bacterium]